MNPVPVTDITVSVPVWILIGIVIPLVCVLLAWWLNNRSLRNMLLDNYQVLQANLEEIKGLKQQIAKLKAGRRSS